MKKIRRRSNFEAKLLEELKVVVARRSAEQRVSTEVAASSSAWRRVPRLAVGAVAVVLTATAALFVDSGGDGATAAFAVEPQNGGGVTIKVYSPEDAAGLEAALAAAGIRSQVTWLPAGESCREPHFTPSTARTAMGGSIGRLTMAGPGAAMTIGIMSAEQYRASWAEHRRGEITAEEFHGSVGNINLDPAGLRPDQSVVISGAPGPSPDRGVVVHGPNGPYDVDPEGGYEAHFAIAEGPVEPCEAIRAPDGGPLEMMNRVITKEAAGK